MKSESNYDVLDGDDIVATGRSDRQIPARESISRRYLTWAALLPFGVDTLFYLTDRFGVHSVLGLPIAGLYTIAILSGFAYALILSRRRKPTPDIVSAILALVALQIAYLTAFGHMADLGYYSTVYLLVAAAIVIVPPSEENIRRGAEALVMAIFVLVVLSLILSLFVPDVVISINPIRHPWANLLSQPLGRFNGLFIGPGVFGLYCCMLVCFACLRREARYLAYALVGLVGLLLSDSRASFLALGLCSAVFLASFVFEDRRLWFRRQGSKISLVAVVTAVAYFATLGVTGLMSGSEHRLEIWKQGLVDGTVARSELPKVDFPHPHNVILAALDSPSIVTTVLLVLASILIFVVAIANVKSRNLLAVMLLLPILVYSSFEFGIHWSRLNIPTMGLVLGLVASRYRPQWAGAGSKWEV